MGYIIYVFDIFVLVLRESLWKLGPLRHRTESKTICSLVGFYTSGAEPPIKLLDFYSLGSLHMSSCALAVLVASHHVIVIHIIFRFLGVSSPSRQHLNDLLSVKPVCNFLPTMALLLCRRYWSFCDA